MSTIHDTLRRALVAGLLVGSALLAWAPLAEAAWSTASTGTAAGAATSMPTGATPTVVSGGTTVRVGWTAVTMANDVAVAGYVVNRYSAVTGAAGTVGPGCSGIVLTTTCTESGVPPGSWYYTDTPVQVSWTGGQSAASATLLIP